MYVLSVALFCLRPLLSFATRSQEKGSLWCHRHRQRPRLLCCNFQQKTKVTFYTARSKKTLWKLSSASFSVVLLLSIVLLSSLFLVVVSSSFLIFLSMRTLIFTSFPPSCPSSLVSCLSKSASNVASDYLPVPLAQSPPSCRLGRCCTLAVIRIARPLWPDSFGFRNWQLVSSGSWGNEISESLRWRELLERILGKIVLRRKEMLLE